MNVEGCWLTHFNNFEKYHDFRVYEKSRKVTEIVQSRKIVVK